MSLNPRQQRFLETYLRTGDAPAAYEAAGYRTRGHASEAASSRLLQNVEIQAEIVKSQQAAAARNEITAEWVLRRLKEESEYDGEGASRSARVKALQLLGMHVNLFVTKIEIENRHTLTIKRVITHVADRDQHRSNGAAAPGAGGLLLQ